MLTSPFSSVVERILPAGFPPFAFSMAARFTGIHSIVETYTSLQSQGEDRTISERLLDHLHVKYKLPDRDLAQIPKTGPVVVVVNHPFGILEGAVLGTAIRRVRPDVRFLANGILTVIPELRELVIPVDPIEPAAASNSGGLRRALHYLRQGGLLIVFPAGEVSHFQWSQRGITDPAWSPSIARIIQIATRQGGAVSVVPVFVDGANSLLFQAAGLLHPRLRTALLARELLNKKSKTVDVRIGSPIDAQKLLAIPTNEERIQYLRWRTYLLGNRQQYKANTRLPAHGTKPSRLEPVTSPQDSEQMASEIAHLDPGDRLASSGDLAVYLSTSGRIPTVLQEIGRLRELTFRAVGEGTGNATDLDRFDTHYLHLFIWNAAKHEVVGAYRLGVIAPGTPLSNLYTAKLFQYDERFLVSMGPALELGRSFVRAEYQKAFAPLLLLWKGIGKFVAKNPRFKTLFGPVSISNQYQSMSRDLMVSFLERHASLNPLRSFTRSRCPDVSKEAFGLDELSDVVSDLEPNRAGVPVLLRQYLRLGGKLLGFHVDPDFSNALDGLILVDLTQTEPKLLERYLGKPEAAQFMQFHKEQSDTHQNIRNH